MAMRLLSTRSTESMSPVQLRVDDVRCRGPVPALTDRSPAAGGRPRRKLPPGYVIGVDDHLTISFWREKDMSADVVVRPTGASPCRC
jgi:hypothetical protein